jgi:nitroreductase
MDMDLKTVDHLLTTTRSVRRRLDLERPVDLDVVMECLEIAIQAPSGSNRQGWRFMIVIDQEKRQAIAEYYRKAFSVYIGQSAATRRQPDADDPRLSRAEKVRDSSIYLADNMHRVPVLVIPCIKGRAERGPLVAQASQYGSILPAAWSFMLALRSRGLGSSWTTLHLFYEKEVSELLGIPEDVTQAALLPVAYYSGDDFRPARRIPASELTYLDSWEAQSTTS